MTRKVRNSPRSANNHNLANTASVPPPPASQLTTAAAGKPEKRRRNRPDLKNFGAEKCSESEMSNYIRDMRAGLELPAVDPSDPVAVQERIWQYLDYCEEHGKKPQIAGLANWLGVARSTVHSWGAGITRAGAHSDIIKRVVSALESLTVDLALDSKVNPANLIFILKNHYGYRDNIEITAQRRDTLEDGTSSADEIAEKYARLPDYSSSLDG